MLKQMLRAAMSYYPMATSSAQMPLILSIQITHRVCWGYLDAKSNGYVRSGQIFDRDYGA